MRITNRFGLPAPIVKAYGQETGPGLDTETWTIRTTTLIRPPQITALELQHQDQLECDITSRLHIMAGTAFHEYLERRGGHVTDAEVGLKARYGRWTVTGTADWIDGPILSDWKTTNSAKITWRDYHEWETQLNVYRALALRSGFTGVIALQVWAYIRDWTAAQAAKSDRYPQQPMVCVPLPTWTTEKAENYILSQLRQIEAAIDGEPRPCTKSETWNGRRCANYCSVSRFCDQYQESLDDV